MMGLPGAGRGMAKVLKRVREAITGAVPVRAVRGVLVVRGVHVVRGVRVGQEMSSRGGLLPCADAGVAPGARLKGGFRVWDAGSPLAVGQAHECLNVAT